MTVFSTYLSLIVPVSYACFLLLRYFSLSFIYNSLSGYFSGGFVFSIGVTTVLISILCVLAYYISKPFDTMVREIKTEKKVPTKEEMEKCLSCFKKLNRLTLAFDFVGFFLGQSIITISGVAKGRYEFDAVRIGLIILQAVSFGGIGAMITINGLENRLASHRKLLRIHNLDIFAKQKSHRISSTIILTFIVSSCFIGLNMFSVVYGTFYSGLGTQYLVKGISCFLVTLALSGLAFGFVIYGLTTRMKSTRESLDNIALKGDLTQRVDITVLDDFGSLTTSLNTMIKKLSEMIKSLAEKTFDASSAADVISQSTIEASSALEQMTSTLYKINDNSSNQNNLIHQADENILRLTDSVENVKKRVIEQSDSMENISASINEMSANINSVAETAKKAQVTSENLSNTSEVGRQSIQNAIVSMNQIQQSSSEVQKMVKVIQEIARQTNLLSMNAAIEAAHAGYYGAGFAVVADEVRSLAESSAKSAKGIQNSIKDMAEKIDAGVGAMNSAGESFTNIAQQVILNAQYVHNISSAMDEQRYGAQETQKSAITVVENVKAVNDLAQEETADAEKVREFMKTVVSASESTMDAVKESLNASSNLKNSIDSVEKSSHENKVSVGVIQTHVEKFSV